MQIFKKATDECDLLAVGLRYVEIADAKQFEQKQEATKFKQQVAKRFIVSANAVIAKN